MDPALTCYDKRAMYVTFDVTEYLRRGTNAVGVWLGNGRFFAPRIRVPTLTKTFGYPKLLFQLHVEYADGSAEDLARMSSGRSPPLARSGRTTNLMAKNTTRGGSKTAGRRPASMTAPGVRCRWSPPREGSSLRRCWNRCG